jgi:predicted nucleic acid-binding protein
MAQRALADTSVFIGLGAARFEVGRFADFEWGISSITLGELRLGVLQARDPETASRRLSTYQLAQRFQALVVDEAVSEAWALLVTASRGRRGHPGQHGRRGRPRAAARRRVLGRA